MPKFWSKRVGYCGKARLLPADGEGGKNVKQGQSHFFCLGVQSERVEGHEGVSTFGERRQPGEKGQVEPPLVLCCAESFGGFVGCAIT